jgi:xanthine dehydrogenase molybdopterin-binding subunit B
MHRYIEGHVGSIEVSCRHGLSIDHLPFSSSHEGTIRVIVFHCIQVFGCVIQKVKVVRMGGGGPGKTSSHLYASLLSSPGKEGGSPSKESQMMRGSRNWALFVAKYPSHSSTNQDLGRASVVRMVQLESVNA